MKYIKNIRSRLFLKGVLIIFLINTPFLSVSQEVDHYALGDLYYQKAFDAFGKNSDSVLFYITKSAESFEKGECWQEYIIMINTFCSYYDIKNDFEKRRQYALKALDECDKHVDKTNIAYAVSLGNHSFYLKDIGDYSTALKNFKVVLDIERKNHQYEYALSSLKTIGKTYDDLGDLDKAIQYYNECLYLELDHPGAMNPQNKVDIFRSRGMDYLKKNEFEKAISDLRNANASLPKHDKSNVNRLLTILLNYDFATYHLRHKNLDSLKYYVDKAFMYCTGDYTTEKEHGHMLLGKYYLLNEDPKLAINKFLEAASLIKIKHKKSPKHIRYSEIYNLLGDAYHSNKEYDKALTYFKKSIYNLSLKEDEKQLVPLLEKVYNPYFSMKAYEGIGKASFELYKQNQEEEFLIASNISFENATKLIFDVRKSYQVNNSLLRFSEEALTLYESAIETSIELYRQTGEKKHHIKAFNYNEKSKAILLLETINESSAIQFSNIPDTLLIKENELKSNIAMLNRKIYNLQNNLEKNNSFVLNKLKQQLFKDNEEYENLVNKFETSFPEYYELKYDNEDVDLSSIQQNLNGSDKQLIEIFYGDHKIYIFAISHDNISVESIDRNEELDREIHKIKDFLNNPPSSQNVEAELQTYVKCSKNIYDQLIKASIFEESKHLIFICDGPLGYVPFEALIIKDANSDRVSYSLENLSYLFEEYEISYSYSSTLFINSFKAQTYDTKNDFIGIAPSFEDLRFNSTRICNENALFSLQCSEDEVHSIKRILGGKILVGEEATLENTTQEILNSKIIHLATHACLDDNNPEFNKIYLADDYLSNNDLYNLKLNSELVVLSACETGSGRLAKGEGVMSLARGFIHAGCPSIIMSLWSIDDCATSKIMVDFYDNLEKGQLKTQALRNAKLNYIKKAKKANQHPYYWAAFVQIGNYNPISNGSSPILLYSILGISLVLGIFLFFLKKR